MLPQNRRRMDELLAETQRLIDNPNVGTKALKIRMDAIEAEARQIEAEDAASRGTRAKFAVGPGDTDTAFHTKDLGADPGLSVKTKGAVPRFKAPSIADATTDQWHAAWEAAQRHQNYRFEIEPTVTTKGGFDSNGVRTKAALSSGSFGGLPPVIEPGLTQQLPYEPNYLFDSFIQMNMAAPTVEYLVHSGNAQPASVVAELGTKPDIGVVVTPKTATATKLAGLVSTSWELYNDFPTMASFLPLELGRAVRDATTDWIINTAGTGLIWRTDTLTRLIGADTPLDAIEKARDDIRVGPMFATADTIVLHPNTLGYLKRQKKHAGVLPLKSRSADRACLQHLGYGHRRNHKIADELCGSVRFQGGHYRLYAAGTHRRHELVRRYSVFD
jgi:HK97 family phage major capsid protein